MIIFYCFDDPDGGIFSVESTPSVLYDSNEMHYTASIIFSGSKMFDTPDRLRMMKTFSSSLL